MEELPDKIGRYPIVGRLATGGMAEILLGKVIGPSGFERPVVIKRALPHLAGQQAYVDMFLDEANIVAGIRHPNVVHVQELGQADGELFMVMEYLDGESAATLQRRLQKAGRQLPYGLASHIVSEACSGLHAAHELTDAEGRPLNVVHRDLSPHNIFITYSGQIKLIDFGVALALGRRTRTDAGQVKGKFAYMSPEQCTGRRVDRRSDLFSMGTVLYELSTGRRLFERSNKVFVLAAICKQDFPPPSTLCDGYPPDLERVVLRALERNPDERYGTAAEMRKDLYRVVGAQELETSPTDMLASMMEELFDSRITEKSNMIRLVKSGREIETVPAAHVDLDVDLPWVSQTAATLVAPKRPAGGDAGLASEDATILSPAVRRRRAAIAAVGGLTVAVLLALVLTRQGDGTDGASSPLGTTGPASAAPTPTATEAPTETSKASEDREVEFTIESTPSGATVIADGVERGKTPAQFTMPRGDDSLEVVVELEGYLPWIEQVVPEADVKRHPKLKPLDWQSPAPRGPRPQGKPKFRRFN
ncbi:MAG: serine/threonine protein kinase [Deltaproteobacteria bacterium]|nr:serine/threonine protein kinase [Deltaproteobacteria bacterium]MBW2531768.1 serine/threonine protein kinase [Deltaproteobacteria bacterium]